MKTCENCGQRLVDHAVFCSACGANLEAAEADAIDELANDLDKRIPRSNSIWDPWEMVGMFIVIFVGVFILTLLRCI